MIIVKNTTILSMNEKNYSLGIVSIKIRIYSKEIIISLAAKDSVKY